MKPCRSLSTSCPKLRSTRSSTAESIGRSAAVVDDSNTFLVPDVAFLRYERLKRIAAEEREQPPIAPDVVVEVRSKGEKAGFRNRKIAKYLACGTVWVLNADPATRRIEAHAKGGVRVYWIGETFEHPATPWLVFDTDDAFAGREYFAK